MLETSAKEASDSVRLCEHVGVRAAFQLVECLALLPIPVLRSGGIFEEVCGIVCFLVLVLLP